MSDLAKRIRVAAYEAWKPFGKPVPYDLCREAANRIEELERMDREAATHRAMSDLVERLRERRPKLEWTDYVDLMHEAADRFEELEAALREISDVLANDSAPHVSKAANIARAALKENRRPVD